MESLTTEPVARRPILAHSTVAVLWSGLAISLFGDHLYRVALTWTITLHAGGTMWLGLGMALPAALFGLLGGAIVDRSDRMRLLVLSDLVRALIVGLMAVSALGVLSSTGSAVAGAFVLATAGVCFTPALQAALPQIVGREPERLTAMNALILSTMSSVAVVGPALASALLPVIGPHWLLAADAVSFLASAAAVTVLRRRAVEPQRPAGGGRRSVRGLTSSVGDGLRFVFGDPILRPQFIVYPAMESATYATVFLLPGLIRHTFSASSWLFGLLLAANAAGRVTGFWLVGRSWLKTRRGPILAGNFVAQGTAMAAFTVAPSAWAAVLFFGLAGLPSGAAQVALSGYLQTEVPMEMRGRCFAAITSFSTWLMPLGPLVFGALAAWHGDRFAFAAVAVAFLAGGAFICSHRSVREVR